MWYEHEGRSAGVQRSNYCTVLPRAAFKWAAMEDYLIRRKLHFDVAKDNGWYPSDGAGDYAPRIVIPATSSIPENRYWQARAVTQGNEPRYQSPRAARGDAIIVVWPRGVPKDASVDGAVVEGPMDALAAAGAGCVGVALMGAMPPEAALALTATILGGRMVYVVFDRDQPGPMVTRTLPYLLQQGVMAKLVDPYPAKDLADLHPRERERLLT
mgnify:CR=1 FL=1